MRTFLLPFLTAFLFLRPAALVQAEEAQAVIDKAIKAFGGEAKLVKLKGSEIHTKGTIIQPAGNISFTQETFFQQPGQLREVLTIQANGQQVTLTTVLNGDKAWLNVAGKTQDLEGKLLTEVKESAHLARILRLTCLRERTFELSPLGEVKDESRVAIGIKVTSRGYRDVNLYFDKDTGLLLRTQRQAVDVLTGKEFSEERVFREYRDVDGLKSAKKVFFNRDGAKLMDMEVSDARFLESLDDSTFAKP